MWRKSNKIIPLILYLLNNIYIYSKKRHKHCLRAGHLVRDMIHQPNTGILTNLIDVAYYGPKYIQTEYDFRF